MYGIQLDVYALELNVLFAYGVRNQLLRILEDGAAAFPMKITIGQGSRVRGKAR